MAKQKILVAEDEKVTQALYQKGLPEDSCDLKIVSNGEQAVTVFNEWEPDITLLDIGMPIMNGYKALQSIRKTEKGKSSTIIMVTSTSDKDNIIACAKIGIQGYIVKPFKTASIAKKIFGLHGENKKNSKK